MVSCQFIFLMKIYWRFGLVAAFFLAIFCLYPQFKMYYLRGSEWNGHYAYNDIDEVAYASYIRALIDGRPRKNDPYSGRDDSPSSPQPESLFSIQFAAPYTIALPARLLGVGTPWAMTIAGAAAGFLAAIACFWVVTRITGSNWFGMAASLAVFAGGALAAGEGAIPEILFDGFSYPYFPGFRRYIPALAITAIFIMLAAFWRLIEIWDAAAGPPSYRQVNRTPNADRLPVIGVIITSFGYTVYSYFYVWTTAAAFIACLMLIWLIARPENWRRDVRDMLLTAAGCALVTIPYVYLLTQRADTLDHVQLLVYTRVPDLFRVPEYIGLVVLMILAAGVAAGRFAFRDRATLFAGALALVPFVIFNQQIITGRSLQPIHYQVFIGNYIAGLSLIVTAGLLLRDILRKNDLPAQMASVAIAVAAVVWGFVECHYTVRVLDEANIERDLSLPVARRLEELAIRDTDPHRSTVLAFDMIQADDMPSVAPQNVLWARHQHVFAGLSWEESKERFYQYLHYSNIDERSLDHLLKNDFVAQIALFGWGRHTDRLSFDAKPLTYGEVDEEVGNYWAYRQNFSRAHAADPLLTYVVVNNEAETDLSVVDQWYERDEGEIIGKYTLYRVKLR